jgi:cell division protein FtsB
MTPLGTPAPARSHVLSRTPAEMVFRGRAADATPRVRRPITGRALVLGAVIVTLVVLLAAPLHRYVTARSNLQHAEQQRIADQRQVAQLTQQSKQLDDPSYIESQARSRLQYALPGETVYTVVRPGEKTGVDSTTSKSTQPTRAPGDTWNERLWGSVEAAGGP